MEHLRIKHTETSNYSLHFVPGADLSNWFQHSFLMSLDMALESFLTQNFRKPLPIYQKIP